MAQIIFFGTCAGTEPMKNMHHASFAIEKDGYYYWFDAGEGCSRTAHLMGVDMSKVKSIFISHPHIDHLGGFMNVIYTIWKIGVMKNTLPPDKKIDFYMSDMELWERFKAVMHGMDLKWEKWFDINSHAITDGIIYEDENISVEAVHNHHMPPTENLKYRSYSFRVKIDGKTVVCSGDVRDMEDIERVIGDGCDYLIMETGHHKIKDVCDVADRLNVGKLIFSHNGRAIINDIEAAKEEMKSCTKNPIIAEDRMIIEI